ncbi:MAG: hypothetical protein ABIJ09_13370 [Pseudomonadota bacterium]
MAVPRALVNICLVGLLAAGASCQCGLEPTSPDGAEIRDGAVSDRVIGDRSVSPDSLVADASAGDALDDAGDAGFVCTYPDIPPHTVDEDAGGATCPDELADLTGSFSGYWQGRVFGDTIFTGPFDMTSSGAMIFEIGCAGDKLWVSGVMRGVAQGGYPFEGQIVGSFDALTSQIEMIVDPAYLCFSVPSEDAGAAEDGAPVDAGFQCGSLGMAFKVALRGTRSGTSFSNGSWCGNSTFPTGCMGEGAWSASQD